MSKTDTQQQRFRAMIDLIMEAGFQPHGETDQLHVRIPTVQNPVFGGIGGERATFGGRARFEHPLTKVRVTVGPQTVNFYRVGPRKVIGRPEITMLGAAKTRDIEKVRAFLRLAGVQ